jgi:hypothetical protein
MIEFFAENGYKYILALGVVITDNPQAQTLFADKNGIEIILNCLKLNGDFSISLSKWSIWILMVRRFFYFIGCMYNYIYIYTYIYTFTHTSIICRYIHIYMYTYIRIHIYMYVCIYIYIYILDNIMILTSLNIFQIICFLQIIVYAYGLTIVLDTLHMYICKYIYIYIH